MFLGKIKQQHLDMHRGFCLLRRTCLFPRLHEVQNPGRPTKAPNAGRFIRSASPGQTKQPEHVVLLVSLIIEPNTNHTLQTIFERSGLTPVLSQVEAYRPVPGGSSGALAVLGAAVAGPGSENLV